MPHEYKNGETVDGDQEGPVVHGINGGASGNTVVPVNLDSDGDVQIDVLSMPAVTGSVISQPFVSAVTVYGGVTVTNSATLIASEDATRSWIEVTNNGTGTLYLGFSNQVAVSGANMGLKVVPDGSWSQGGFLSKSAVYGIYSASAAAENVAYAYGTNTL